LAVRTEGEAQVVVYLDEARAQMAELPLRDPWKEELAALIDSLAGRVK
jgi:hypothetical protein